MSLLEIKYRLKISGTSAVMEAIVFTALESIQ
jgi:hypothetical protein